MKIRRLPMISDAPIITSSRIFRRWILKVLPGSRILWLTLALLTCEHLADVKNNLLVGKNLKSVESGSSWIWGTGQHRARSSPASWGTREFSPGAGEGDAPASLSHL